MPCCASTPLRGSCRSCCAAALTSHRHQLYGPSTDTLLLLQTAWGSYKTTAAVRRMLERGLTDPFALQFLLLSETGER